jgi:CRP/FNR family transcriptional regulator, dissimilatory nitrate respiration regulator
MKHFHDTLVESLLFAGLPQDQLQSIQNIIVEKEFGKGETIFSEGDKGAGFYVVSQGLVKIFKVSLEGKEQILHIFGPGEVFGEVPVFMGENYPANAVSIQKSRLLFFPRVAFVDLISQNPSLSLNMLAVLSMRLRQFAAQIENLSLKEVPGRLASYLILLYREQDQTGSILLTISKSQLASLLGTIPETLSRILAKMSSRNLIEVNGKEITLLDMDGLEDLAESGKI